MIFAHVEMTYATVEDIKVVVMFVSKTQPSTSNGLGRCLIIPL